MWSAAVGPTQTNSLRYENHWLYVWAIFGCAEAELAGAESFGE